MRKPSECFVCRARLSRFRSSKTLLKRSATFRRADTICWLNSSVEKIQRPRAVEAAVYGSLARIFSGNSDEPSAFTEDLEDAAADQPTMMFAKAEIEAWLGTRETGYVC